MPKVSITMATYNVALYIRESLDSVCNQTFKDTEIIIIDDNSKDGTQEILKDYQQRDNRIQIVLKDKNEGLSVSRNTALEMAQGDYVTFVDGDDVIDLSLVEKAYNTAISKNADMVLWDYCPFYKSEELPNIDRYSTALSTFNVKDKVALLRRPGFACSRLIRREVVSRLGLHFPEGMTKQDIPIHWKLVTCLERIVLVPERLYFYRQQPGATSARKDKSVFSLAYVMDIVEKQLQGEQLYEIYRDEFWKQRLSKLQGMYDFIVPEYKDKALDMVKERLNNDAWEYIHSSRCELTSRNKAFYEMLEGNLIATLKYKGTMAARWLYRKIKN